MTAEDTIILSFQDLISKHTKYHIVEDIPTKTFLKSSKHCVVQQSKIKKGREGWIHTLLPMNQGCSETDPTSNKYFCLDSSPACTIHTECRFSLSSFKSQFYTYSNVRCFQIFLFYLLSK